MFELAGCGISAINSVVGTGATGCGAERGHAFGHHGPGHLPRIPFIAINILGYRSMCFDLLRPWDCELAMRLDGTSSRRRRRRQSLRKHTSVDP